MNKTQFATRVAKALRENEIKKPITTQKHRFVISDDEGNTANFNVKKKDKLVLYTYDDVLNIIDACIAVITDAIKHGEEIFIKGFGSLGVHYRAARRTKQPGTDDWYDVPGRYIPKFNYGTELRMAAKVYELSLEDEPQDQDGGDC